MHIYVHICKIKKYKYIKFGNCNWHWLTNWSVLRPGTWDYCSNFLSDLPAYPVFHINSIVAQQQLDIVFKVKPKSIHILASLFPQNFPILVKLVSLLFFKHLFTLPHLFIVFLCMTLLLPILLCLLKSYLSCKTSSRNELTLCFSLL